MSSVLQCNSFLNSTFDTCAPLTLYLFCQDVAEQRELPLYGSGGFRFLWDTKFDAAMVAFLDCLQQFKEAVERGDSGFSLPYRMERGRIEDSTTGNSFSIKYVKFQKTDVNVYFSISK